MWSVWFPQMFQKYKDKQLVLKKLSLFTQNSAQQIAFFTQAFKGWLKRALLKSKCYILRESNVKCLLQKNFCNV